MLDERLKQLILRNLSTFQVRELPVAGYKRAAVAVALTEEGYGANLDGLARPASWSSQAALILTRRSLTLRSHRGQWALPGGRVDSAESVTQAALRELAEEVGIQLREDAVLGRLDDFATRSGYLVSPVIVWAGAGAEAQANPDEVDEIHRIRISEFMRADAPMLEPGNDVARPILRMPVGRTWIAAPTAAVLYQFRELCLAGRHTRVVHFDQPGFAWR